MNQYQPFLLAISLVVILISCTANYSPRPWGYFRIDILDPSYQLNSTLSNIEFNLSNQAIIIIASQNKKEEFFNIVYPALNAQIYCSFILIQKHNLVELCEESRRFAYFHTMKADAIVEQTFNNSQQQVYGICYDIEGNVASHCQFILTDSIRSFFRGALYFETTPNQDSIAPVLKHIRNDIQVLIESFRWKQKKS